MAADLSKHFLAVPEKNRFITAVDCNFSKLPLESSVERTGGERRFKDVSRMLLLSPKQGMTAWKCDAAYFANGCRMRIRNAHTNSFKNSRPDRRGRQKER